MPSARFALLLLSVIAAAALTVWVASLAGFAWGAGNAALWSLPPLIAAGLLLLAARRR